MEYNFVSVWHIGCNSYPLLHHYETLTAFPLHPNRIPLFGLPQLLTLSKSLQGLTHSSPLLVPLLLPQVRIRICLSCISATMKEIETVNHPQTNIRGSATWGKPLHWQAYNNRYIYTFLYIALCLMAIILLWKKCSSFIEKVVIISHSSCNDCQGTDWCQTYHFQA